MISDRSLVVVFPFESTPDRTRALAALAAFADGPVADTAEPVAAEAGVVGAEPDRDDGDTMGHER